MNYVYKYVSDGKIIYIGKTKDLKARIAVHGRAGDNIKKQYWDEINAAEVYYMGLPDGYAADMVETILINKYKPKCNQAKFIGDCDHLRINMLEHDEDWHPYRIKHEQVEKTVSAKRYNDLLKKYEKLSQDAENWKKREERERIDNVRLLRIAFGLKTAVEKIWILRNSNIKDADRYVLKGMKERAKAHAHAYEVAGNIIQTCLNERDYKWVVGDSNKLDDPVGSCGIVVIRNGQKVFETE